MLTFVLLQSQSCHAKQRSREAIARAPHTHGAAMSADRNDPPIASTPHEE